MSRLLNRREALGLAGTVTLATAAGAWAQPAGGTQPVEGEALAWLRGNARPLASHDPAPAELADAVAALAVAQVIGLGEATQGGHEEQSLKAALAKALIARGDIRLVALEGNSRAAAQLDRYVRSGGPDPLEMLRTTPFPQAWLTEPFVGLLSWIRAWNLTAPDQVGIAGTESQSLGADAFDAYRWLDNNARPLAQPLERDLRPLIANPRLRDAPAHELVASVNAGALTAARAALVQLHAAIQVTNRAGQEEAAGRALSARQALDSAMRGGASEANASGARSRQLAENLLSASGEARALLWSDNAGVATGIGAALRARLGRRYRAVVFAFESGSVHARTGNPADTLRTSSPWQISARTATPGSTGVLGGAAGPDIFWVDLAPASGAPPAAVMPAPGADLLIFVRRLTPSRLLPFVPQSR